MPDVFISYAREDREFARRLVDQLKQRGHDSWIDLEGIEPSDRWWQSVTEAIDGADAVVFIASPDSVASEVCAREIKHAAEQHKRLIPVVCRDVEGLDVPAEIAELNWIFLRAQDDWPEGVAKLERALELDIELVRVHTRVLTRAEAWRLAGRRPSPLLRGEELRAAEQWLARAAQGDEPQPTELQSEFIVASRQVSTRRQRLAIAASLGVAAIAVGLSIFAFIQRAQARHEAKLAESRQLAASAEAQLTTAPESAIALAARGLRIAPTLQAEHALWAALQASRLRAEFAGTSPVESVTFSPNGRELAVGSADGRVRVWGVADRRLLWTEQGRAPVAGVSFSSQGDVLLVDRVPSTFNSCSIEVLNAATGALERTLGPFSTNCFFAVVPHTRTIELGTGDGTVQPWSIDSGQPVGPFRQVVGSSAIPSALAISPDGRKLALLSLHQVNVLNTSTLGQITTISPLEAVSFNPSAIAFSPDGSQLLMSGEYATQIYIFASGALSDLYAQDGSTVGAAWSPDGDVLAAGAGFIGVDVWSSSTRLVEALPGGSAQGFDAVAFSSTGLLAGGSRDGSVRLWAPNPDLPDRIQPTPAALPLSQAYDAPRSHFAVFGDARSGILVTDDTGRPIRAVPLHGEGPMYGPRPFAVASNGELAFVRAGQLNVLRLPAGQQVRSWKLPTSTPPAAIAVSANAATAATTSAGGLLTVVSGHRTLTAKLAPPGNVNITQPLSMSPDGRLLAVITRSEVEIFDTSNLRVVQHQPGVAVSFSPSGRLIAIQRPDLSIAVISTSDSRTQTTIGGEPSLVTQLSFSPDDRLLAAIGSTDGALKVWDTSDGTQIADRQVIESSLQAGRVLPPPVVLTGAGDALVAAPGFSDINVYDVCDQCFDPGALLAQADARLKQIASVRAGG